MSWTGAWDFARFRHRPDQSFSAKFDLVSENQRASEIRRTGETIALRSAKPVIPDVVTRCHAILYPLQNQNRAH